MKPAKKLREDDKPEPPDTDSADIMALVKFFEAKYLRARIEIANANKGIKRLKRVVEARDKKIESLQWKLDSAHWTITAEYKDGVAAGTADMRPGANTVIRK